MNKNENQKELDETQKTLENLIKFNPDELDETFDSEKKYLEGKIMGLEMALLSDGNLPSKCPNCGNDDTNWNWTDNVVYDEQIINEAQCPECKTVFNEIMEVIGWEKKE